jgi:hypothetical protein
MKLAQGLGSHCARAEILVNTPKLLLRGHDIGVRTDVRRRNGVDADGANPVFSGKDSRSLACCLVGTNRAATFFARILPHDSEGTCMNCNQPRPGGTVDLQ